MLEVNFSKIAPELKEIPRWVVWRFEGRRKVPYLAKPHGKACDVTKPSNWVPFEQARITCEMGRFSGVGFVLSPDDDVVGVDLDNCVINGRPKPEAMAVLERIGAAYIELSPSGTGLRAFGRFKGAISRKQGVINGVSVELYTDLRYLTVTGHVLLDGGLVDLGGFADVSKALAGKGATEENGREQKNTEDYRRELKRTEDYRGLQKITENTENTEEHRSQGGGVIPKPFPTSCYPSVAGQRNKCLFELARFLKAQMPDAKPLQLRKIVMSWHKDVLPIIETKEFEETWADFMRGWDKVKTPYGETMDGIIEASKNISLPDYLAEMEYSQRAESLIRVCIAAQRHHGEDPFFLPSRVAGEVLDVHYTVAAKMLKALVLDGVIEVVEEGKMGRGARYRLRIDVT